MTPSATRLVFGLAALLTGASRAPGQQPAPQPTAECCTAVEYKFT